jgi:hypothetical protein
MSPDLRLSYLVFEVSHPSRWTAFCEHMLGLPAPLANADGSSKLRLQLKMAAGMIARKVAGMPRQAKEPA